MVRDWALSGGQHLSRASRQRTRKLARHSDVVELSVAIYTTEAKDCAVHVSRRSSRRDPSAHRMGCREWQFESASLGTLRHPVLLAISTFHGDLLDVPGRLRACGLSCTSTRKGESSIRGCADRVA